MRRLGQVQKAINSLPGVDLLVWLKADAITGLIDGDPVTTWIDSSGNGYDFTQATAAKKPVYKTAILNGKPVVRFDGVDDVLVKSYVPILNPINASMFVVANMTDAALTTYRGVFSNKKDAQDGMNLITGSGLYAFRTLHGDGIAYTYIIGSTFVVNVFYSLVAKNDGATGSLYRNGSFEALASRALGYSINSDLSVGSFYSNTLTSLLWQGDVAEVLFFNGALSLGHQQVIEQYLRTKYAHY